MRPIYGGLKGKNVRSTNVAKQRMPSANVFDVVKSLERGNNHFVINPSDQSQCDQTCGECLLERE